MNRFNTFRTFVAGMVLAVAATAGLAAGGHDHDEGAAATTQTASPRFAAHSDLFEMVGIVTPGQMVVFLDRYATNEPVVNARIEFESGTEKGVAAPQADGTYLIKLDTLGRPGDLAFSFAVTAGNDTDLLAGDLSLGDSHAHAAAGQPWLRWLAYALLVISFVAAATFVIRRRRAQGVSWNWTQTS